MHLVTGHDRAVAAWIETTFGDVMAKPGFAWGVVDGQGEIKGAFVVTLEHNSTAELHVYGTISNDTVRAMFRNVFASGIYRLSIKTRRDNKTVRKAAPKYGFQFEGIQRHFYGKGVDALCFYMTPEQCRWLNG